MKIAIVGLGLIGGSLAKAIKSRTTHTVYGENRSESTLQKAIEAGAVDMPLSAQHLAMCDVIIVALYPKLTIKWLSEHAESIKKDAVVIDTCGVKSEVCCECGKLAERFGFTFIGAHPMAGVEHSGFDYAREDMFQNASMILVPLKGVEDEKMLRIRELSAQLGFGRIVVTDAEEHDRMIAFTSQLAHVVSSAYVQSPCALRHQGFSAGSYRDMTRVATLNEDMWTELFLENADPLAQQTDELIERLQEFSAVIKRRDEKTLKDMLRNGRLQKSKADGKELR